MSASVKATTRMRDEEGEQGCPDLDDLQYRCRLCGKPLSNSRALFHAPCLKEDKRRRIAAQRQAEHERFERQLKLTQIRCPQCGRELSPKVKAGSRISPRTGRPANRTVCEASTSDG